MQTNTAKIDLIAEVTAAIKALQNGQEQAVKAVAKLGIHETDPLAHGIEHKTSPFRKTVCTVAEEAARLAAIEEIAKQLITSESDLKEAISDAVINLADSITPGAIGALPVDGNAVSASKLQTPRDIAISGGVVGNVAFDGSGNVTLTTTLANLDASKITSGTLSRPTTGNAATATKLQTARTIALTGGITGSVNFDGSKDVTLSTTEMSQTLGAVSGTVSLNLAAGLCISATIAGTTTLNVTNVPAGVVAVLLELTNGGNHSVTWGMSPRWSNGVAPALTANGVDLVALYHRNGVWSGVLVASNVRR